MTAPTVSPQTLPLVVHGDTGQSELAGHVAAEREHLRTMLGVHGALLFRNFRVDGVQAFESVVRAFSGEPLVYAERSSPRHTIKGNVYTSTDYPPDEEIFLHNENSYQASWPRTLFFYCVKPPTTEGSTPLADIRRLYQAIDPSIRTEFEQRGWKVVRNYYPHFGVDWRDVFGTENRDEVVEYCRRNAIEAEWKSADHLRTSAVRKTTYQHPDSGVPVWFNHFTFFHYTTLAPDLQEGLLGMFGEDGLPTNTYYGDGGRVPDDVVAELRRCYRAESRRFDWQQDDVLVVDNMLASHGREPFTGPRKIAVAMAEPYVSQPAAEARR